MNINLIDKLILFPLIFLAGFVDSIAGGGGLISLPAYLFIGLPSHNALATNKLSSSIGTIVSVLRYNHGKAIIFEIGVFSAIFSFIGSFLGARIAMFIPDNILKIVLAILIPIATLFILFRHNSMHKEDNSINFSRMKVIVLSSIIGFFIGAYDGFFGPGTGTFLIIAYVSILSIDHVKASGTAKIVNLASNVSALTAFIIGGKVIFSIGLPAAIFGIAGHWIGSGLALKKGSKIIKPIIIVVLTILFIKILFDII
ncbi:TSUP family transporter [Marinitoga aeolica]|uniref:Probable membrane transporter protein n=1 Tax=Marinitoga aeolica TaxID=2809031 RepID=A0ABY8PQL6_9BACT|nr:TSUP family transporter [Marinitoga aeolica]WGS64942.1 TSUP family transporter [Marinitoga aeolica]